MVHQRGIKANSDKIQAILRMSTPTNLKQLPSLNGKIAALSRFINMTTDKYLPFFKVLRKGILIWMTKECNKAFLKLKTYLGKVPLLAKPTQGDNLLLYLAVSGTTVNSTLIKEDNGRQHPVYYTSISMAEAETRYL